ncbi:hypothetical protein ACJWUX_06410 [Klebsiella pneumoniae]
MSFTLQLTAKSRTSYPEYGIVCDSEDVTVEATFEVTGVSNLSGDSAIADYSVTIDGKQGNSCQFLFIYSGTGNPVTEAETALKASLSS